MAWERIEQLLGIFAVEEDDAAPGLLASLKRAQARLNPSIGAALESLADQEHVAEDLFVVAATLLALAMEMLDEQVYANFPEDAKESIGQIFVLASLLLQSEYYADGKDDEEKPPPNVVLN